MNEHSKLVVLEIKNFTLNLTERAYLPTPTKGELAAASREGAGFRLACTVSRCPKPWHSQGEAVAPAPVGVPEGQGVSRRRSANPAVSRSFTRGPFPAPSGGLKKYDLYAIALGVAFKSF